MITIKKGLDIPISGCPDAVIEEAPTARSVALVGYDYVGMRPTMLVQEGEQVRTGQVLFTDKKTPGVQYTAPACGTISQINRGAKRVFESIVIDCEGDNPVEFQKFEREQIARASRADLQSVLVESGLWTALRTRPLSKVPAPDSTASAIFVSAMDTNPLAADPAAVISEHAEAFVDGLAALTRLECGPVYLVSAGQDIPGKSVSGVQHEQFSGPHPAGLVGTHIHFLQPVHAKRTVWTVGYQDVIAIGKLLTTGRLWTERVVSLGGPAVSRPRLLKTRLGASLDELTAGELASGNIRVISGSVLAGRQVEGPVAYLGRYHNQVSALAEGHDREFLGWFSPGTQRHSSKRIYLSHWFGRGRKLPMNTNTNGSERAIVPISAYENVMPLDILATPLLKALVTGDTELAQHLGALELDEEDLGLCSYVCPGKYEFGRILRDNLTRIEKGE